MVNVVLSAARMQSSRASKTIKQTSRVSLQPQAPGNVEVSIAKISEMIPESKDWDEATQKRVCLSSI